MTTDTILFMIVFFFSIQNGKRLNGTTRNWEFWENIELVSFHESQD